MADETRLLSIGESLRDPRVEHSVFGSTRTLLEHEIVLWNPASLLAPYGKKRAQYKGSPSLTDDASAAYERDAQRRGQEFRDYLGLGRLLVVMLPAPTRFYVATGERQNEGTPGKPRLTRVVAPRALDDLIPVEFELVSASGDKFTLRTGAPFAAFWSAVGDQFHYLAYMSDAPGTALLSIKNADRVVATLVEANGGTVLMIPQRYTFSPDLDQEEDESDEAFDQRWEKADQDMDARVSAAFVDALLELARELRGSPDEAMPEWASRFVLPTEAVALAAVEKADTQAARALKKAEQLRSDLLGLQRQKVLITGTGKQLEMAVEQALMALGCSVETGDLGRTDRIVRWKGRTAVLEVKGLGKSAGERDAAQLEKWVSEYTVEHGKVPKGMLLANAWRAKPLDERDPPAFPNQMVPYAKSRGQCLATTAQLLCALATATSARKKNEFLQALFDTEGVLDGWHWKDALEAEITPEDSEAE